MGPTRSERAGGGIAFITPLGQRQRHHPGGAGVGVPRRASLRLSSGSAQGPPRFGARQRRKPCTAPCLLTVGGGRAPLALAASEHRSAPFSPPPLPPSQISPRPFHLFLHYNCIYSCFCSPRTLPQGGRRAPHL